MTKKTVVIFGNKDAGKTALFNTLVKGDSGLQHSASKISNLMEYGEMTLGSDTLSLLEISGEQKYLPLIKLNARSAAMGLCCIDVFNEINLPSLQQWINEFRNTAPSAPIIFVLTKGDLVYDLSEEQRNSITATVLGLKQSDQDTVVVVSAWDGNGIPKLKSEMSKIIVRANQEECFAKYTAELLPQLKVLSDDEQSAINTEIEALHKHLQQINIGYSVELFMQRCDEILNGKHPNVLNTLLTFVTLVVGTLIAAVAGFGIGFAAGIWTGPGAFITGLVGGTAASVGLMAGSGAVGATVAGLAAWGLFSDSAETKALGHFAATSAQLYNHNPIL